MTELAVDSAMDLVVTPEKESPEEDVTDMMDMLIMAVEDDAFIENPIWTSSTPKPLQRSTSTTTTSTSPYIRLHSQPRMRAKSHSSTISTLSQRHRMSELMSFHQILQQPLTPIQGLERSQKIKPTHLESLQLSLELILSHRKTMTTPTFDDESSLSDSFTDSEDDMEILDQMAMTTLAAAQRAREHAVTIEMRGMGISDSEVAAAAIASWRDDIPQKLRNSPSPVPSLTRLSVSLAGLTNPRVVSSSVGELFGRLDAFAVEMEGMIVELTELSDRIDGEMKKDSHGDIMKAMGLDTGGRDTPGSISSSGFYPDEDDSYRSSPRPNDTDSIFESPKMVRTKSGHAKAVRMMGMSEKEEANLFRRSVMPGTTVPSDQPIESPTDRRQTLSGLPQNFQPILGNDSDSDDSILPASLSRKKKRPVSTIKALRMMGLNESDHPQRSFRPMSMMTPPSSDGFQSPKALKIMGIAPQIPPAAETPRRPSLVSSPTTTQRRPSLTTSMPRRPSQSTFTSHDDSDDDRSNRRASRRRSKSAKAIRRMGLENSDTLSSYLSQHPSMQGYLQIHTMSTVFRSWKKRYFVLIPATSSLHFFASADASERCLGTVDVGLGTDVASARGPVFKGKPVVQVSVREGTGLKVWNLLAEDETIKGAWMKALVEVIMAAKPGSINTSFGGLPFVPTQRADNVPPGTEFGRRPSLGLLNLSGFNTTPSTSLHLDGLPEMKTFSPIMGAGGLDFDVRKSIDWGGKS